MASGFDLPARRSESDADAKESRGTPTPTASAGCISPPFEKKGASAGSAGVPSTSSIDPRRRFSDPTRNHVAAAAQHRKPPRRRRRRGYPSDGESHCIDPIGPREEGSGVLEHSEHLFHKTNADTIQSGGIPTPKASEADISTGRGATRASGGSLGVPLKHSIAPRRRI